MALSACGTLSRPKCYSLSFPYRVSEVCSVLLAAVSAKERYTAPGREAVPWLWGNAALLSMHLATDGQATNRGSRRGSIPEPRRLEISGVQRPHGISSISPAPICQHLAARGMHDFLADARHVPHCLSETKRAKLSRTAPLGNPPSPIMGVGGDRSNHAASVPPSFGLLAPVVRLASRRFHQEDW